MTCSAHSARAQSRGVASGAPAAPGRARCIVPWACLLMLLALCGLGAGCATPAWAPIDTAQHGWSLRQGQALWQPRSGIPELAGDLILARHTDGRIFVQFSKIPLTLAEARLGTNEWAIRFPPQKLSFGGRGLPPARFGWLQLAGAAQGHPVVSPWTIAPLEDGWKLENPRTGEKIEAHLWP